MKEKQTSQLLEKEFPNEALQDHVEGIRNVIREKFGINPSKVGLEDEIPLDFIPQDNCGHSRWEGAEEHYDDLYGWSPEEGLQHLDIEKEYNFSDNGEPRYRAGETLGDFLSREKQDFLFYINKYKGKPYGETGEWYEGVNVYKSPNFNEKLSDMQDNGNELKQDLLMKSLGKINIGTNKDLKNTLQLEPESKVKNIVEAILSKRGIKFCGEIHPEFVPQNNCGHSRWEGAEEHYDDLYGWSPEEGLQHLDIEKEYSFSDNGKNFHEAGETMIDFFERDGRQFQYYVDVYSGKEYGEDGEQYEGVSLFKSPDFQKELSKIEEEDFKRWKTRLNS